MHTQGTDSNNSQGGGFATAAANAPQDTRLRMRLENGGANGAGHAQQPALGSPLDPTPPASAFGGEIMMRSEGDTLYVTGDIDLYQAPRFRSAGEEHVRSVAQPRIDLHEVPFLDSAGLAVLLVLARQAREQNKSLRVVATGSPRRVLRITGIDRVLTVEDPSN